MAGRIRSIKPEILDDEEAARLSDVAWRVWLSCWLLADDHGNLRAGHRYLAAQIFQDTGREADVHAALSVLARRRRPGAPPFLHLYRVGGNPYAHIVGWKVAGDVVHQRIANPSTPRVPVPADEDPPSGSAPSTIPSTSKPSVGSSPPPSAELVGSSPRACAPDPDHRSPITDPDPERHERGSVTAPPPDSSPPGGAPDPWGIAPPGTDPDTPPPPPKPKRGAKPKPDPITLEQLAPAERAVADAIAGDRSLAPICKDVPQLARDLVAAAPAVNVLLEVRGLGAWLRANPGRGKSNGNAFLLRNIARKQREAEERGAPTVETPAPAVPERAPPPAPPLPAGVTAAAAVLKARGATAPGAIADLFSGIGKRRPAPEGEPC